MHQLFGMLDGSQEDERKKLLESPNSCLPHLPALALKILVPNLLTLTENSKWLLWEKGKQMHAPSTEGRNDEQEMAAQDPVC